MELSQLLRYYRSKLNMSLEAVGDYVGVAKSTIKRWESGESRNVPQAKLDKLSELFDVNVAACLNGQVKPILGYVKAGYDFFAQENLLGYEEVTMKEASLGDYYLRVEGDSMSGSRIYAGDLVYVKRCSDINSGDIALLLIDQQEVTIKKVVKKDDSLILLATNPIYEPRIFHKEDLQQGRLQVLGKVLHSKIQF